MVGTLSQLLFFKTYLVSYLVIKLFERKTESMNGAGEGQKQRERKEQTAP